MGRTASGGMPAPATIATAAGGRRWMRRFGLAALTAVMMAALAAAAWWWRFGERPTLSPQRLVHLTSSPGSELFPALSPDGKQVAFQWNGEDGKNWDIYVKLVGETNALRLTTDALVDSDPCWSPDGRRIAFTRRGADGRYAVLTMSPLGGAEQKLADLPGLLRRDLLVTGREVAGGGAQPSVRGREGRLRRDLRRPGVRRRSGASHVPTVTLARSSPGFLTRWRIAGFREEHGA